MWRTASRALEVGHCTALSLILASAPSAAEPRGHATRAVGVQGRPAAVVSGVEGEDRALSGPRHSPTSRSGRMHGGGAHESGRVTLALRRWGPVRRDGRSAVGGAISGTSSMQTIRSHPQEQVRVRRLDSDRRRSPEMRTLRAGDERANEGTYGVSVPHASRSPISSGEC